MKRKSSLMKMLPDVGVKVKLLLLEKRISQADFSRRAGWSETTTTRLLKRRNWTVAQIKQVGLVLNTNLFIYYLPENAEGMVPAAMVHELTSEILELKNKLSETEAMAKQQHGEIAALERIIAAGKGG